MDNTESHTESKTESQSKKRKRKDIKNQNPPPVKRPTLKVTTTPNFSSQEKTEIDYSKMQVSALKKLATERQLAPNVHKLRKKELVTLLQA